MIASAPTPDRDEIRLAIKVLHAPDAVIELRALHKGRKATSAGYFDGEHREQLIDEVIRLNREGAAVYVVMNPLDPQLLARHANRVQPFAQATATDNNVTRRHWLLIDVDPQRPKDTSATPEQLEAAMERARKVYTSLAERGWAKPVVAESGNGAHLLYRIDLPNDEQSRDLVKGCLESLAAKFDDSAVKIDRSVFNAARIVKLHGTVANKGDHVPGAPWRLSKLRKVPDQIGTVSLEQLQELAAEISPPERPKANGHANGSSGRAWTETEVQAFLSRGGIESSSPEPHNGSLRWKLKTCPFNPDHGQAESAIFLAPDGKLGFKCLHNSCQDKHWRDLRELVDGPRSTNGSDSRPAVAEVAGVAGSRRVAPPAVVAEVAAVAVAAEPTPLVRPMPVAASYPVDALGPVLGSAARALAQIVQVPDALAANSILATAALAAQPHGNVQTLGGVRPLSLFILTVAGSGDRKTAADDVALLPIKDHVRRTTLAYQKELAEHERGAAARKLARSRAREAAGTPDEYQEALAGIVDEPKPRKPWLVCTEPTGEGLVKSLAEGQFAQGIYSDEGGQFLGGHGMSEEAELRTIAMLSRAWQGAPLDRVRATDSEHVILYGRRLSMHLLAQPEVAARLLGSQLYRSQGFLARWLIAAPASLAGTRIHNPESPAPYDDARLQAFYRAVTQLIGQRPLEDHEVGGLNPPCIALSPEARQLLARAYDELERAQGAGEDLEQVREWASKAAEQACRIAGVITLVNDPEAIRVEAETMGNALRLTEFYLSEYQRMVGHAGIPEETRRAQVLLEWLKRKGVRVFTARQVMQLGPNSIRSADVARAAIRVLEDNHWVSSDDGRTYRVHEALFVEEAT
jgi:hypothetical protein